MFFKKYSRSILALILFAVTVQVTAQETERLNWRINAGVGYGTYYGDVSHYRLQKLSDWRNLKYFLNYNKHYVHTPSLHLSLERKFSDRSGVIFSGNYTAISMSDRYLSSDGKLRRSNPNFDRALNFSTQILDAGVAYKLKSNEKAFIAPYVWLGGGYSFFDTYGDLLDANRKLYNYASADVNTDGAFETDLRAQLTETDAPYRNNAPYANAGLGIAFKLSKVLSLGIESDIKYSFSDYLDDVSGNYKSRYATPEQAYAAKPGTNTVNPMDPSRGNNDGVNDFYIQNRIVFKYNFFAASKRKESSSRSFRAPYIYPSYYPEYNRDSNGVEDIAVKKTTRQLMATDSLKAQNVNQQASAIDSVLHQQETNITNLNKSLDSVNRRVDTIDVKLRQLEQKDRADTINRKLDSLQRLVNTIDRKARRTSIDTLRRQLYQLQADSIRSDALRKGIDANSLRNVSSNSSSGAGRASLSSDSTSTDVSLKTSVPQARADSLVTTDAATATVRMQNSRADSIQSRLDSLLQRQQFIMADTAQGTGTRRTVAKDTVIIARTISVGDTISRQRMQALDDKMQQLLNSNDSIRNSLDYIYLQRDAVQVQITNDSLRLQDLRRQQQALESATEPETGKKGFRLFKRNKNTTDETRRQQDAAALEMNRLERDLENLLNRNASLERQVQAREGYYGSSSNVNRRYYRDIEDELRQLNRQLGRERQYTVVNPVMPVQRVDNTAAQREINQLRNELQQMREADMRSQLRTATDSAAKQSANNAATLEEMTRKLEAVTRELSALKQQGNQPVVAKPAASVVSVYFNSGSASASPAQRTKLTRLRSALEGNDMASIELKAYTDATGNLRVNEALSRKRAAYVKNYLVQEFGVRVENIEVSFSPSSKAAGGVSNPLDRRVDILINPKQ